MLEDNGLSTKDNNNDMLYAEELCYFLFVFLLNLYTLKPLDEMSQMGTCITFPFIAFIPLLRCLFWEIHFMYMALLLLLNFNLSFSNPII